MTRYFNDIEINKQKKKKEVRLGRILDTHPENTIYVHFEVDII